jgi:hypothetical protein
MKYRKSIVTFLDILGFKETVLSKPADEVHDRLTRLSSHAKPDKRNAKQFAMKFVTFSDCTVRSVPIETKNNIDYPLGLLFFEIMNLYFAQVGLLQDGYFIRGALTIGDIHVDRQTIFGPAMAKAYGLEQEFAVYPRIIIDPIVFTEITTNPLLIHEDHDLKTEKNYYRHFLTRDADGLYFVDYLRASLTEFEDNNEIFDFFQQHKQLIVEAASTQDTLSEIAAKYLWLANYHNNFMHKGIRRDSWRTYGRKKKDFVITTKEFPLLCEL